MDLKNKRKHYVKIDTVTTSEHVLVLLDIVESDEEDKIDNLMRGKSQKGKMGTVVMMGVICSFLTLMSILCQQEMGKTSPKKLRKVK